MFGDILALILITKTKDAYYYPMGATKYTYINIGEVSTAKFNNGLYGYNVTDPVSYNYPASIISNYLYRGGLWIGANVNGGLVSAEFYNDELESDDNYINPVTGFRYIGPGKSAKDVYAVFKEASSVSPKLGVRVFERTLSWPNKPYNQFFIHEYWVMFDPSLKDAAIPNSIDSVFIGVWFDADACAASTRPSFWYDNLVFFDGLYKKAIDEDPRYLSLNGYTTDDPLLEYLNGVNFGLEDKYTILGDNAILEPDGIPDGYIVWGDDPIERQISAKAGVDTTNLPTLPDGRKYIYLIPRGMSYIFYDARDKTVNEENIKRCPGFVFASFIWADPTINDSVFSANNIMPAGRIVRPHAHQWWNIETDPPSAGQANADMYYYMAGHIAKTEYYRFVPIPLDRNATQFDYRFLLTIGPYSVTYPDTIRFVLVTGVGYGLNGGNDNYYKGGAYILGARQLVEIAYRAFYLGTNCDPGHPDNCPPNPEQFPDNHYKVPIPPPSPSLRYSSQAGDVILVWDNRPEITPDYVTNELDFAGYAIYRTLFAPSFRMPTQNDRGSLLAISFKNGTPDSRKDSIVKSLYNLSLQQLRDLGVIIIDTLVRSFVDNTVSPGFPYFYAVSAFDFPTTDPLTYGLSQQSALDNYLKTSTGAPLPLYVGSEVSGDDWRDKVRVVPNPLKGSAPWSATKIAQEIEFQNLPSSARVDIFTLSGDHIITLYHNNPASGSLKWNLLTKNGFLVSPGVYIAKISDSKGNSKILRFMILR
ncbi:MAG: hypothetical protein ABIL78_04860 [candidate division WOR-3 bacterium]